MRFKQPAAVQLACFASALRPLAHSHEALGQPSPWLSPSRSSLARGRTAFGLRPARRPAAAARRNLWASLAVRVAYSPRSRG